MKSHEAKPISFFKDKENAYATIKSRNYEPMTVF